jgi:ribonuclease P protein component
VPRYSESAVNRNRLKRHLRELARTRLLSTPATMDVVIRARPEAYGAVFDALEVDLMRVATHLARPS